MVWALARTDFKLRYQGSILGFVWVLIKPLITFLIMNFVFQYVFKGGAQYSLGLFTGIILWSFFAEGTTVGLMSLLSKGHIMTKIYVPKWIIVIASTLNTLLNFSLQLVVLAVFYVFYQIFPSPLAILGSLYYCTLIYAIILSFSFLTAPLYLKVRDLNQIWEVILTAGFYASPILFPLEIMPSTIQTILYLNPMTFIIVHIKNFLLKGAFVQPWHHVAYTALVAIILYLSYQVFQRTSKRAAENV